LSWAPQPNGSINTLAVAGGTVYVGGDFTRVGHAMRAHLASLDTGQGRATAWNARERATIERLVVAQRAVFVIRDSAQPEDSLAAYDRATGKQLRWRPAPNDHVNALARSHHSLYAGGSFTGLRSAKRFALAAVNLKTGSLERWNPKLVGSDYPPRPTVDAIESDGHQLYVGGDFAKAAGKKRGNLAAFDLTNGALTDWNPGSDGEISAIVVADSGVFVAGQFEHVAGAAHERLAKVDTDGNALPFAAEISGVGFILALARSHNALYVGGEFETANGKERNGACAFDIDSGALLPWNPDPDSVVWTLAASDSSIYAGGVFTEIGGKSRMSAAALDPGTGAAQETNLGIRGSAVLGSGASALVSSLVLNGSKLYVGGDFDRVAGMHREDLAVIDVNTGRPTAWNPRPTGPSFDQEIDAIVPADDSVIVGGAFLSIGGRPQPHLAFFR
jgi:hypothetical protein